MTKKAFTPFRKGLSGLGDHGSGPSKFISISPDESVTIAPLTGLDEMLSADMHEFWEVNPFVSMPCLGPGCPACETGNKARFKAYLPVATQDNESKIFSFGIQVARQLEEIEDAAGSLKGQVIRIKRTGSGLKTRYQAVPLGKKIKADAITPLDIALEIGAADAETQRKILAERGLLAGKIGSEEAEDSDGWGDSDLADLEEEDGFEDV